MAKPCPTCGFHYAYHGYWTVECANPSCVRVTVNTMRDYRDQVIVRNNGTLTLQWMKDAKAKGYEAPELGPALKKQADEYLSLKKELDQLTYAPFMSVFPSFYYPTSPPPPPPMPKKAPPARSP